MSKWLSHSETLPFRDIGARCETRSCCIGRSSALTFFSHPRIVSVCSILCTARISWLRECTQGRCEHIRSSQTSSSNTTPRTEHLRPNDGNVIQKHTAMSCAYNILSSCSVVLTGARGGSRIDTTLQWYKDDGTPRTQSRTGLQGCHWPKCSFAHPGTPQWETASSSRPPESYEKAEYSRSVKREDGRERERQDRERLDREREWEREREEREKERIRDREREVERERERDSDRDRDRERARSPRVPTGPSASTSATRDPRLARSSASSSSVAGPSSSGSTSYPPNNPSTPSRSGVSTLTRHDTMSMATATTTSVTHSPQLDRSNTAPSGSYTSASRARGYSTASVERSRYGSRDRDRSPMSSTSESRPRVESSSSYARVRQDTSTSTVIPQSPALPTATVKAISAMPPPPVLKLGKAASPAPVSTTPATQSASKSSTTGTTAAGSAQVPSRNDKVRIWVDRIKCVPFSLTLPSTAQ